VLAGAGLALIGAFAGRSARAAEEAYTLGVIPYRAASELEPVYAPVAAELAAALGRPVRFRTAGTSADFLPRLRQGGFDIALVQPFYYLAAVDEAGYQPLARVAEPFEAQLIARADGPVREVEDLRGRTVATPPRYSPNTVILLQALRERGLRPGADFRLETMPTQSACLHQVLTGAAEACASGSAQVAAAGRRVGLRTLLQADGLPGLAFIAHPRVPAPERERLRQALLALNDRPAGRALLQSLQTAALVPADDGDAEAVRRFVGRLEEPWLPPGR
jgi:phosphonate transport system substrate-binding protein